MGLPPLTCGVLGLPPPEELGGGADFLTLPSGWKGGGAILGLGGRARLEVSPPLPPPGPPFMTTFLNSSLTGDFPRFLGLESSPWRLEFRPGTLIPPAAGGGGTSGLSGLSAFGGGLSGLFRDFGMGLVEGEGVGDLLPPCKKLETKFSHVNNSAGFSQN